jgi:hypothetical protein
MTSQGIAKFIVTVVISKLLFALAHEIGWREREGE